MASFINSFASLTEGRETKRRYDYDSWQLSQDADTMEADIKNKYQQGLRSQFMATREFGYQVGSEIANRSTTGVGGPSSDTAMARARSRFNEESRNFGEQLAFAKSQGMKKVEELKRHSGELRRRGQWEEQQSYLRFAGNLFGGFASTMA